MPVGKNGICSGMRGIPLEKGGNTSWKRWHMFWNAWNPTGKPGNASWKKWHKFWKRWNTTGKRWKCQLENMA